MSGNIELLSDTLAAAKAEDRAALIAYLPAGFPTVDGGIEAVKAVFDGGADVVEVGPAAQRPGARRPGHPDRRRHRPARRRARSPT